jgi:ubiquitin-conjugating enzyme E2 I
LGEAPPDFGEAPPDFGEAPPDIGEAPPDFSEAPPDFGGGGAPPPSFGDDRSRSLRKSKGRRKRSGGDGDGAMRARRRERRRESKSERTNKSSRKREKQSRLELHKAADVATTRMQLRVREVRGQLRQELQTSTEESLMLVLGEMAEQSKSLTASLDNVQAQSAVRVAALQQSVIQQMQAMSIDQRAQSSAIELQLQSMRQDLFAAVANVRTTTQQSTKEREIARDAAGRGANLREQLQLWEASTLPSLGFELHPPITGIEGVGVPWRCLLPGRRATVHDGALYTMRMCFSKEYPRTPPMCTIDPPLQWHPNIDKTSGNIQLPMLCKEGWMGHRYSVADIAANVQQLLHSAHIEGAINAAAASLFTDNPYALKSRLRTESQNPSVLKCRTRSPVETSVNAEGSRPQIVPWKNQRPLTSSGDRMRLHIDART